MVPHTVRVLLGATVALLSWACTDGTTGGVQVSSSGGGSGTSSAGTASSVQAGSSSAEAPSSSRAQVSSGVAADSSSVGDASSQQAASSAAGPSSSVGGGSSAALGSSSSAAGPACERPEQQCRDATGAALCCQDRARCCAAAQLGIPEDVCVDAEAPCPLPCEGGGACAVGSFCVRTMDGDTQCAPTCPGVRRCGFNGCCAAGSTCSGSTCEAGDLVPDAALLTSSLRVTARTITDGSCDERDGCAAMAGVRKAATFQLVLTNMGTSDVQLGRPAESGAHNPLTCSNTPALPGFVGWELLGTDLDVVASGSFAAVCLRDESADGAYTCAFQGLSAGAHSPNLLAPTCNFIDVTNITPGAYTLRVRVNASAAVAEEDLSNNTVEVPLVVPGECVGGTLCGGVCCPQDFTCTAAGVCQMPDLTVDPDLLGSSVQFSSETFSQSDCAIMEGCLRGGGLRRLLRFSTSTPNVGEADFYVGRPEESSMAQFSACHGHYHYHEYAHYRLLNADGEEVVRGAKQAFCLTDIQPVLPNAPERQYGCDFQGITRGWTDIYSSALDCQWVDVTGVPEGDYTLEIEVNPRRFIPEMNYENNTARVSVRVPQDPNVCVPRAEVCWDGLDQDCDDIPDNGCMPITGVSTCATALQVSADTVAPVALAVPPAGEGVVPSCGGQGGQAVFSINVAFDQLAYISTHGSAVDTVISVRGGTCASPEVSCVDDTCDAAQGHWAGTLREGPNLVVVRAKEAVEGTLQFKVELAGCAGVQPLENNGPHNGTTVGRPNTKTATCGTGPTPGPEDHWYFTTCPGTARATFSTCTVGAAGQNFDTVVEIGQGRCRGRPVANACDDDDATACPGQQYASMVGADLRGTGAGDGMWFVMVEAYSEASASPYVLNASVIRQ